MKKYLVVTIICTTFVQVGEGQLNYKDIVPWYLPHSAFTDGVFSLDFYPLLVDNAVNKDG